ncbi:hypothetical protein FBU30_001643 [Linnemannia zychae]|nr:hypothetical protein FBU30_001643 [Linnemannia zychae]
MTTPSTTKDTQHPYQHLQWNGSISHSIRSVATGGIHSAAASVYELANDQPFDDRIESTPITTTTTKHPTDPSYHEVTETLVEEEILDDDEYANEIQKVTMAQSPISSQSQDDKNDTDADDEEEDDVYQSSEEYDDNESDRGHSLDTVRPSIEIHPVSVTITQKQQSRDNDFVDEGVFDEEEKDELDADVDASSQFKLEPSAPMTDITFVEKDIAPLSSSAQILGSGQDKAGSVSPVVEPYRVNVVHQTITTPSSTIDHTHSPAAVPPHAEEAVCPVSKKTASSGGVCPAAMFAQARAAAAAASPKSNEEASETLQSAQSSPGPATTSTTTNTKPEETTPLENSVQHHRAVTEPAPSAPVPSSSSTSSAVQAATNQGRRIGQGIVSRFTALRSSLAAASARAASSALSGGASSTPNDKNAVTVKDPVTNQTVTIVCPHLQTTQVLETEVVRLQTEISVLHERLDLLQESLKIKSQTRALERRSARGILKLVLRQGLINAVLLLIVFAVLYKRKSPIAFAILAYIGQGAKEGEAGWKALMRWLADKIHQGQRNHQLVLRAGRRNGYW